MHLSWYVYHMIKKTNQIRPWYNTSFDFIFFDKITSLIPTFFPIILAYITNKTYPGNPHFMLCQSVEKLIKVPFQDEKKDL